ncbi:C-type lectin domain family 3 member A-like [Branchiostoma lanceolatum]|uniref:C-type lectin domain family 3 member A-like n=1 Tax=Branchiostoma lanceolatum TaxID=7740 RepID=UPI003456B8FF
MMLDRDDVSSTVDALKSDQDDMSTIVDALKRNQDDKSITVDALRRNQDNMSVTVDALKRDQDNMRQLSTTVDALKRDQDDMRQLSTTVDALKRDQDNMYQLPTTVDALKRDYDVMSTTVDALKLDLEKERSRTAALEQRLNEMNYTMWHEICYKASNTRKTFSEAAASCREDGGTLAMPRDAETNAFLISLYKSVSYRSAYWFGLHDRREEGSFEWVDGSALGMYNSWHPGQPDNNKGNEDCVHYWNGHEDKWNDISCHVSHHFLCQAVPGTHCNRVIS